jgi:hypothetical protein
MARCYIHVQKKPVRLPITHGVFPSVSNGGRNPSRDQAKRKAFLSPSSKPAGVGPAFRRPPRRSETPRLLESCNEFLPYISTSNIGAHC